MNANRKLDAQAKALAEYQRQAAAEKSGYTRKSTLPPPVRGTRSSARLRGSTHDGGWQPVPDEWLNDDDYRSPPVKPTVGEDEEEDDAASSLSSLSDLTDLPEDEEPAHSSDKSDDIAPESGHEEPPVSEPEVQAKTAPPAEFIEWETVINFP
jgi:hypothetical protein